MAYKIGELKILELRSKAEEELGDNFNIRDFHDIILGSGAVPLDVLEKHIEEYIDSSAALSMYMNQCFYQKLEYQSKSNMESYIPSPTLASMVDLTMDPSVYKSSLKLFDYQKNSLRKLMLLEREQYPLNIDITYKKIQI